MDTNDNFELKYITLRLNSNDRRFGFSIIGGCDELMSPEIEDISPGSSADKSDLQIGDEILAINGLSVEDFDHAKIIAHIHKCIKERIITLKVKRTFKTNELSINENIKEAFIIGVDDKAKERLNNLTKANKATPIDIEQLEFDSSPELIKKQQLEKLEEKSYLITPEMVKAETPKKTNIQQTNSSNKRVAPIAPLMQSPIMLDPTQKQDLFSITSSSNKSSTKSCSSNHSTSSNSSITKPILKKTIQSENIELMNLRDDNSKMVNLLNSTSSAISSNSSLSSPNHNFFDDDFSTREVAIDCPDNFIPSTKTKPTYPPTQLQQPEPTYTLTKNFTIPATPSPLSTFKKDKKQSSNQKSSKKLIEKQKQTQESDAMRKVKDEQEAILRNSLRNSEKLRNLGNQNKENHQPVKTQIYNNDAFVNDSPQKRDINNDIQRLNERYGFTTIASQETVKILSNSIESHVDHVEIDFKMEEKQLKVDNPVKPKAQIKEEQHKQDVFELRQLYQSKELQNALTLYQQNTCVTQTSFELVQEITRLIELAKKNNNKMGVAPDSSELLQLLSKINVKSVLKTHDELASNLISSCSAESSNTNTLRKPASTISPVKTKEIAFSDESVLLLSKAEHYCVENLKLVNIDKPDAPLGATIKNCESSIIIGRIVKGGAADMSGLLHEGDEILEINGIPMRGKTINEVCDMLADLKGTISFLIIPNLNVQPAKPIQEKPKHLEIIHLRALFNYEPEEDIYLPCKELGLSFLKGDILHVTSKEDQDWWQAYKDNDDNQTLAHLIPSQSFQERRFSQMQALIGDSFMDRKRSGGLCVKAPSKNKRRKMFENALNETLLDEISTYEKVILYKPNENQKRPIVLIGPHNIGRHELRKRLMQSNPSLYEVAVPHTTRPPRKDEVDGKDYHFLPRHIFEADIKQGRFIEHGEFEKNLYGTSTEAIKKVIENSKICVLNLYPQALKVLRGSDLMPYVIYIGPPSLAKIKELKTSLNESFKENDLLDIIDKGREIEELYGHYFDKIIRNTDMDKTYNELVDTIDKVQSEEHWIPEAWLKK